jgi:RNA recognition motif-containing protein
VVAHQQQQQQQAFPMMQPPQQNSGSSAQVHVSFRSNQRLVTEEFLRSIFERFGEVTEIAIKRSNFQQVRKTSFLPFIFVY